MKKEKNNFEKVLGVIMFYLWFHWLELRISQGYIDRTIKKYQRQRIAQRVSIRTCTGLRQKWRLIARVILKNDRLRRSYEKKKKNEKEAPEGRTGSEYFL